MSENQDILASRYGRKSGKLSPTSIAVAAVLLTVFFSFAIYSSFFAKPAASVEVTSYQKLDDHHVQASFTAFTADKPAACVFKAFNDSSSIVGYAEVQIPAHNDDTKALQIVVKTVVPASVLRADGCSVK
jgi:hypothetical protein